MPLTSTLCGTAGLISIVSLPALVRRDEATPECSTALEKTADPGAAQGTDDIKQSTTTRKQGESISPRPLPRQMANHERPAPLIGGYGFFTFSLSSDNTKPAGLHAKHHGCRVRPSDFTHFLYILRYFSSPCTQTKVRVMPVSSRLRAGRPMSALRPKRAMKAAKSSNPLLQGLKE